MEKQAVASRDNFYADVVIQRARSVANMNVNETPVWRGDHAFNSDAAKYSLLHFIEPEVANEHPDWSTEKVHTVAITRFQQRLDQDIAYEQKESAHQETAVHWRVVEIEPGIKELATDYGGEMITLAKLWDHTREYAHVTGNPHAYNHEEEMAQYAMEQEFIHGNIQGFVSVLSHPDAVRYVQVWEKDTQGDVVSKQIDVYNSVGRDLTHAEGDLLVAHLASYSQGVTGDVIKSEASYAHFMLRSGVIAESDIRTIVTMQMYAQAVRPMILPMVPIHINETCAMEKSTWRDVSAVVSDVREVIGDAFVHTKQQIIKPLTNDSTHREHIDTHGVSNDRKKIKEQIFPTSEQPATTAVFLKENNPLRQVFLDFSIAETMQYITMSFPEASGGALYWFFHTLNDSSKENDIKIDNKIILSTLSLDMTVNTLQTHVQRFVEWVGMLVKKTQKRSLTLDIGSEKSFEQEIKSPIVSHVENLKTIPSDVFRMKNISFDVYQYILNEIVRFGWSNVDRVYPLDMTKTLLYRNFFAILYFSMFMRREQVFAKARIYADYIPKRESDHESFELIQCSEPPQWVLLSIIWYLTMLREAALPGSSQSFIPPALGTNFPTNGIIFPCPFVIE